ncbi:MAG: polymer-forming cytoskeletal protein [Steroidobacteraceae bacterium]
MPTPRSAHEQGAAARGARGTVDADGHLHIDASVAGPIHHELDVFVGELGRVSGKIRARSITVAGVVQGDLHARETVRLTASGTVFGDLHAQRVGMETGATLRGRITMQKRCDGQPVLDDSRVEQLLNAPASQG